MLYSRINLKNADHLTILEDFPFTIKRIFYASSDEDTLRGGHKHKEMSEILICLKGKIELILNNDRESDFITLEKDQAILIPPNTIRYVLGNLSNSVYLALCSTTYDPKDYY